MAIHAVNLGRFFARLRTVWLFCALVLFTTSFVLVIPNTASAAGENFAWQGQDIAASGGAFATPQFSPSNVTFTKNGAVYTASQRVDFGGGIFCFADYTITLTSGTSGSMLFKYRDCPGQGNETTIPNITITGTPPAGTPGGPAPNTGGVTGVAFIQDAQNATALPVYLNSFPIQLEGENHNAVVTTQGAGNFVFTNVPPGTYTVKAKGQYTDPAAGTFQIDMSKTGVVVTAGQTAQVSLSQTATLNPADTTDTCATQSGALGWLTCPVITWAAEAAESLSVLIVNLLKLDTDTIFNSSNDPSKQATSSAFHSAWAGFRNIAYAILVIIGLIMIASQIFNVEIFNAYTLRKMLPGIIIAIIFVTLSWDLMEFLYNMSNAAADAVTEIIKLPFQQVEAVRDKNIGTVIGGLLQLILFSGAAAGAVVAYAALGGPAVVLALVGSVALTVFSVFLLLAARNVVAYFLVIVAPVPIMLAAFEPLKKGYSFWKGLVVVIIVTVPGVAGILAVTTVGSAIAAAAAQSQTGLDSAFSYISAFVIVVAGLAMTWTLFLQLDKITGFLGNVANKVTGKAQQGLKSFRGNTLKRRTGEVLSGQRDLGLGMSKVGTLMRYGSLVGRPGMSSNIFKKSNREKLAFAENAMMGRTGQELLKNEDGSVSGNDDAMAVITQGVKDDADYDKKYVARKRAQHERKNPGIAWSAEMQADAQNEARSTRSEIIARMDSAINTRATRRAAAHARWTSVSAYNDWDLETEGGRRGMRTEMAEEIGAMMNEGGMTMTEVAATLKKNSQRMDIAGHSFPQIMFQAKEIADRYKARKNGEPIKARKMTADGGVDIDATTGKPREDTVYVDASGRQSLMSAGEMEAWDRRSIEYSTAGQRIGQRTEAVRLQAEVMRERLAETVGHHTEIVGRINVEVDAARAEAKAAQAELEQASAYETRVINSPNPGIPPQQFAQQQQAAQEQTRRIRDRAIAAQQKVAMAQRKLDEAQQEVIRQLATGSAEHTVMSSYASPENARWFDKLYSSQQMPGQPAGVTIMDYMEQLRQSSDVFRRFERSYTQSASASAAAAVTASTTAAAAGGAIPGGPVTPPPV